MSYKDGCPSTLIGTEPCKKCGLPYYAPEGCSKGEWPVTKRMHGYYLPLCVECKKERKRDQLNARRKSRVKKPRAIDIILKQLKDGPKTREQLLYTNETVRGRISDLRKQGYDIRRTYISTYELMGVI